MPDFLSKKTARAYVISAETAPAYWMIGICWQLLATGVQTGGAFCLADQIVPPGTGPNTHVHPQDEGLYVASRRCIFQAGGKTFEAGRGSFVNIPRHNEHSFTVEEDTRLVTFYLPAGFDVWLMGGAIPAERNGEPQPPGSLQPPHQLIEKLGYDYVGGRPDPTERSTRPNPIATPPSLSSTDGTELFSYDGAAWAVLADDKSTGGSYCMFEVLMPRGRAEVSHIHDDTDEVVYVLDGEIEVVLDGKRERVGANGLAFAPRGTVHGFLAASPTVRLLTIHTKPGFERVVRRLGTRLETFALPVADCPASASFDERSSSATSVCGGFRLSPRRNSIGARV